MCVLCCKCVRAFLVCCESVRVVGEDVFSSMNVYNWRMGGRAWARLWYRPILGTTEPQHISACQYTCLCCAGCAVGGNVGGSGGWCGDVGVGGVLCWV